MKILFRVLTIISVIITLGSFGTYFFVFDRISENILYIIRGIGFIGISGILLSYQYDFRNDLISKNKEKTSLIVTIICIILAIVFISLAIIQFCSYK